MDRYSNDNYPGLPIGMKFMLNEVLYSVYRVDDKRNQVTCTSKVYGFTYIDLSRLETLLETGKAVKISD